MIECEYVEPTLLETIRSVSEKYSKRNQRIKTLEEIGELKEELESAIKRLDKLKEEIESGRNPFDFENCVYFSGNLWSEIADVFIMCTQLIFQHGKEGVVEQKLWHKLHRQIERMRESDMLSDEEYARYSACSGQQWKELMLKTFLRRD